jgi:hypothetical protein
MRSSVAYYYILAIVKRVKTHIFNHVFHVSKGKKTEDVFLRIKAKQQQASLSLYTDICGPMNTELWNGSKYLLTFIDDFT